MAQIEIFRIIVMIAASLACGGVFAVSFFALMIRERRSPSYSYIFELLGAKLSFYQGADRLLVLAFRWGLLGGWALMILNIALLVLQRVG
ncbi:hypothetical protein [Brevundimonas sp.]|uniref:hypothetical protein n=1 Tax=Brevundimonas sp. TaxID=1871086 RepID=UPI0028A1FE4C|nr:hypothetical protein [Brevundimonas sp.]